MAELTARTTREIAAGLSAEGGYGGPGQLDAHHADRVGAAYRHDCLAAHRYFADALEHPPRTRLPVPVTVVVASDDPSTAAFRSRHRDWTLLADHVSLHELADGGHYFFRTRPSEAAHAVLCSAAAEATEHPRGDRDDVLVPHFHA
jgi:pimeloyl-ACP methyl ester carboxylesterase